MPKTCCVCQKEFESGGKTFVLTDEEKKAIGESASDEVDYCGPCIKVMEDQEAGAQLLKGLYEMGLRETGVPGTMTRTMSDRFYQRLIKRGKPH